MWNITFYAFFPKKCYLIERNEELNHCNLGYPNFGQNRSCPMREGIWAGKSGKLGVVPTNILIYIYMSRKICKKRTALHCDNGVIRCDDVDIWWYLSGWWRDLDTSFSVQLIWDLDSFPNLLLSWSWHFISYQKSARKIQLPLFSRKKARKQWRSPSSPSCTPEIHQCSPCDPALGAPQKKIEGRDLCTSRGWETWVTTACLSRLSCLIWKIWWSYRLLWWINACMLQMSRPNSHRSSFCGYNKFSND